MSYMPYRFRTAFWYAVLLWVIGMGWGIIVFGVSTLKDISSVRYISKYPAISIVLLIIYPILLFSLSKSYLELTDRKEIEGLKFGLWLVLITIVLDFLVYFILLESDDYFNYLSIWIAYTLFIAIPWLIGKRL